MLLIVAMLGIATATKITFICLRFSMLHETRVFTLFCVIFVDLIQSKAGQISSKCGDSIIFARRHIVLTPAALNCVGCILVHLSKAQIHAA